MMNKANREPYRGLTAVRLPDRSTASLCSFCKYAKWHGDCVEAELDCAHPLGPKELWEPWEVWAGDGADCWGFRPKMSLEEATDMVGIWLRGQRVAV